MVRDRVGVRMVVVSMAWRGRTGVLVAFSSSSSSSSLLTVAVAVVVVAFCSSLVLSSPLVLFLLPIVRPFTG